MPQSNWLAIRTPLSPARATGLKLCAFLLPLAVWCVLSYVPWVWHPDMRVRESGGSGVRVNSYMAHEKFAEMNALLKENDEKPMIGVRANPYWFPAPHEVARAMYTAFTTAPRTKGDPWLHESLWYSIKLIASGFGIAAVVAIPIGLICGTFDLFSKLTEPFVDFVRYMPAPVFGTLLLGIFGFNDDAKRGLIVVATFFSMTLVIANTARNLDPALLEAAQTLGANRRRLLSRVVLPGVIANLYNDLRIMLGASWTALMIAELIGEKSGLSLFISQQARYFQYDNVYAGIILIGLVGLVTDQVLQFIGQFLFPWQGKPMNSVSRSVMGMVTFVPRKMIGLVRRPRTSPGERVRDVSVA